MSREIGSGSNFRRAALLCSAVAAGLAIAAITGWLLNLYALARIRPEYIPMAPLTALAFLTASLSVFVRILYPLSHRGMYVIRIAAVLILLVSSLLLIQFFAGLKIDIEKIFVQTPQMLGSVPTGRMSPITAISFFLIGSAVLVFSSRGRWKYAGLTASVFATLEIFISFVILLGYLYGVPILYGGNIIPVALTTAISFVFLGLGVLFAFGAKLWPVSSLTGSSTHTKLLRAFLPFVVLLILFKDWCDTVVFSEIGTNPALNSAIAAIVSALIVIIIISRIAKHIGSDIDRAEKALTESEQKYRNLVDNALVGVYRSTLDGKFLYVNDTLAKIFECENVEEMLSAPVWIRYKSPEDREKFLETLQKEGRVGSYELEVPAKTGKLKNIVISAVLEGNIICGMIIDVTEQKKLEEQLVQSQKLEAVGQLTGGIAHDFNNILTAIIGYASLLEMRLQDDDPLRLNVEQIVTSAERAAHLTQNLLAFSRKQILNPAPVKINEIIRNVVELLKRIIGENIELNTILKDEDMTVMADSVYIEQVLMNLATNARDAMSLGGRLTIETEKIEIDDDYIKAHGYGEKGTYVRIAITDTGVGMDEKTRERIFEPFFTTKEIGKGTGLGLSMVYGIIKQHDGYINLYSEPGRGTTFRVLLPLIEPITEKEPVAEECKIPMKGTETILLAEDDESIRSLYKSILQEVGYRIIEAADGEDAIIRFMKNKDDIKLVILDVIMPRKSGKDAYEEIKKIRPDVKALFASGYTEDILQREEIIQEGLNFISKPMSPAKLLKQIREILDK